jgi:hypothetical protein
MKTQIFIHIYIICNMSIIYQEIIIKQSMKKSELKWIFIIVKKNRIKIIDRLLHGFIDHVNSYFCLGNQSMLSSLVYGFHKEMISPNDIDHRWFLGHICNWCTLSRVSNFMVLLLSPGSVSTSSTSKYVKSPSV